MANAMIRKVDVTEFRCVKTNQMNSIAVINKRNNVITNFDQVYLCFKLVLKDFLIRHRQKSVIRTSIAQTFPTSYCVVRKFKLIFH